MKYVIASRYKDEVTIEAITEDPIEYAAAFEPIDILGGKTFAWDESGILYYFGPDKKLGSKDIIKGVSIVDTGKWEVGEPALVKTAMGQVDGMRAALIGFLERRPSSKTKRWWFRREQATSPSSRSNYASMSLGQLISQVGSIL
jgi:hypothetical protein